MSKENDSLQLVYRWKVPNWKALSPLEEHTSPPFIAENISWCFKLFKGRPHSPETTQVSLAVHKSSLDQVKGMRIKLSALILIKDLKNMGISYKYHSKPVNIMIDEENMSFCIPNFIKTKDVNAFIKDNKVCFMVRMEIKEVTYTPARSLHRAVITGADGQIQSPNQTDFNHLLKSKRFSDVEVIVYPPTTPVISSAVSRPSTSLSSASTPSVKSSPRFKSPAITTPRLGSTLSRLSISENNQPPNSSMGVEPKRYVAHRAFLAAVSPFFDALFSNGMRETFEREVVLHDVSPRAFERVLEYAYTRKCGFLLDNVDLEEVIECLICADHLSVEPLAETCWSSIRDRLNHDNVWDIWQLASHYSNTSISNFCRVFCQFHMTEILSNPYSLLAPPDLLQSVLQLDQINIRSEADLLSFVVKWAKCRQSKRTVSYYPSPSLIGSGSQTSRNDNDENSLPGLGISRSAPGQQQRNQVASLGITFPQADRKSKRTFTPMPAGIRHFAKPPLPPQQQNNNKSSSRPLPPLPETPPHSNNASSSASTTSSTKNHKQRNSRRSARQATAIDLFKSPATPVTISNDDTDYESCSSNNNSQTTSEEEEEEEEIVEALNFVGIELDQTDIGQLSDLPTLLRCIRFPQMEKSYLLKTVESLANKIEPDCMKTLLIEAYRHHAFNNDPMLKEQGFTNVVLSLSNNDPLTLARSQPRKPLLSDEYQSIIST